MKFSFPSFKLVYNRETGETKTFFPMQLWSGCLPVPDDSFHGKALGITDKMHRFEHELIHHMIGIFFFGKKFSPVIFRDATNVPQDTEAGQLEEWLVTSFQYFIHDKPYDWGALIDLQKKGIDVYKMKQQALLLLAIAEDEFINEAAVNFIN